MSNILSSGEGVYISPFNQPGQLNWAASYLCLSCSPSSPCTRILWGGSKPLTFTALQGMLTKSTKLPPDFFFPKLVKMRFFNSLYSTTPSSFLFNLNFGTKMSLLYPINITRGDTCSLCNVQISL